VTTTTSSTTVNQQGINPNPILESTPTPTKALRPLLQRVVVMQQAADRTSLICRRIGSSVGKPRLLRFLSISSSICVLFSTCRMTSCLHLFTTSPWIRLISTSRVCHQIWFGSKSKSDHRLLCCMEPF
jgi:hypothetical protein